MSGSAYPMNNGIKHMPEHDGPDLSSLELCSPFKRCIPMMQMSLPVGWISALYHIHLNSLLLKDL